MDKIYISEIVKDTYTNASGYVLLVALRKGLANENLVVLSFKGATPTSSSFLNSSFGELIEELGMEKFKSSIKLVDVNKSQSQVLRNYFNSCDIHA